MGKYTLKLDKDRLAESRKRVSDYYNGRPVDRIPFSFHIQTSGLPHYNYRQCNEDFSKFIEQTIAGVNAQFEGFPDTDYLPMFYLDFLGEGLIASMFGAEQLVVDENPPFTRGRVLNEIDDLDKLPAKVDPENDGWGKRLMQVCDMCMDAAGGEIPICVCDHQSPYGIATKIMDNESLMLAMYDAPEEMMRFMEIVTGAIDGTIAPDFLSGGTFTVSNIGSFGIETFTPVINLPQTAILGVGAITPRPTVAADGTIGVEQRLNLSLTIDHQVIDGADGARFLRDLVAAIENIDVTVLA